MTSKILVYTQSAICLISDIKKEWTKRNLSISKTTDFEEVIKELQYHDYLLIVFSLTNETIEQAQNQIKILRSLTNAPIAVIADKLIDVQMKIDAMANGAEQFLITPVTPEEAAMAGIALIRRFTELSKTIPLTEFDFLGYTFKGVYTKRRDGKRCVSFIASVSKKSGKSFRDKIKGMEIHKSTGCNLSIIAEKLNPIIRGWINYFGKYNASAMKYSLDCIDRRLVRWAMCKYKRFRRHRRMAEKWLNEIKDRESELFAHWKFRSFKTAQG
jgi:Group II intron, maturase-specific domain.